jgi:Anti-sigma-K factor rskA, C-terminal
MESFETTPVIRFYGPTAAAAEIEPVEVDEAEPVTEAPQLRLVSPRTSRAPGVIATLATLAGIAAVGLATWAFVTVVRSVDEEPPALPAAVKPKPARPAAPVKVKPNRALALLALPTTERYRMAGSVGRITLAVVPGDRGFLALNGLWRARRGRTYVAWLVPPAGRTIRSAATFRGGTGLVPLRGRVAPGSAVAVTLEHDRMASGPSRTPRLVAIRRP